MKNKNKDFNKLAVPEIQFVIDHPKIEGDGEDALLCQANDNHCVAAVFDGCGGSGARKYDAYNGKTGAYVASRIAAAATEKWHNAGAIGSPEEYIRPAIMKCSEKSGAKSGLRGSMVKEFPTTAAIISVKEKAERLDVCCHWAGDSRCYHIDRHGLHQLTWDDLDVQDAMENLSEDGVLKNVINASVPYEMHSQHYSAVRRCLLFSATDGCFGYLNSPMEFEFIILDTLMSSKSVDEWKSKLEAVIGERAGDDYTLCMLGYGFASILQIKLWYEARYKRVKEQYIEANGTVDEVWSEYKKAYNSVMPKKKPIE